MLEINGWFFVLMGLFLAMVYILNQLLFKPMLKVFEDREKAIDGALEEARELDATKETRLAALKDDFKKAGVASKERFNALKGEGAEKQRQSLEAAAKEASAILDEARGKLKADAQSARQSLKSDVEKFSDQIVSKLIKVD